MPGDLSRREMFKVAALPLAAAALGAWPLAARAGQPGATPPPPAPPPPAPRTRVLRFAHLTDLHIQPERGADQGVAACLRAVQALPDAPELVVTGGDLIMDSYDTPFDRSKSLWDLFTGTVRRECGLPVQHTLGNHDIFGWNKPKSKTTGSEPQWGKKWALEMLGLAKPYHRFTKAGWRFIVLDSVAPFGDTGYQARLDDEQMDWLKGELASDTSTPTVVVSHIPILTVTALSADEKARTQATRFSEVHADGLAIHEMFARAGNIRLCLSGHLHRHDRIELRASGAPWSSPPVTYLCDGAVCGAWWKGREDRCDEGFGVIDLYADGSFDHRYETYGWKARA